MSATRRPLATACVPDATGVSDGFATGLAEVIAGVLGDAEPTPGLVEVESAVDGPFRLSVGGRPAIVGLQPAADEDVLLDEISRRLLDCLDLWLEPRQPDSQVCRYLARLGMRPRQTIETEEDVVVAAESAMDDVPTEIVLEVPVSVARQASSNDLDAMVQLRREVFHRSGIEFPEIRVRLTEPRLRRLRIGLNSTFLTVRGVPPTAGWDFVVRCLDKALDGRLHWFLRRDRVQATLDDFRYVVPDLVDACRDCYPPDLLTACLRELIHHGQNLRNFTRIMWLLLDLGSNESEPDTFMMTELPLPQPNPVSATDPVVLASRVRKRLREEAWRAGMPAPPVRSGRLSESVEAGLVGADRSAELARWEWAAVRQFDALKQPDVLVVRSVEAILPTVDAVRCFARRPEVVASAELPPDTDLAAIAVAG